MKAQVLWTEPPVLLTPQTTQPGVNANLGLTTAHKDQQMTKPEISTLWTGQDVH